MDNKPIRVLLIEDSVFATQYTKKMLVEAKSPQFSVELSCVDRVSLGLEHLTENGTDIVLLDLTLVDSDGLETFTRVHDHAPQVPIVVMSGLEDERLALDAVQQGAQDYLVKGRVTSSLLKRSILYAVERKQVELKVAGLNRELERRLREIELVSKELEAFSYSVSHDLRAPLRAIDGFSQILLEDHREGLDKEGRRVIDVIRDNTRRMGELINDLLTFSRQGRKEIIKKDIDMEKMVKDIFKELTVLDSEPRIKIKVNILPPAHADQALIRQVLINFLSNAIKFSGNEKSSLVEVGGRLEKDENIYYVKDNGVGFDMKYSDKLFGVFQRLHSQEEFKGTGVGLALVQRIIHRHQGRVWAEGKVNKGATFYFSVPLREGTRKEKEK
ncbi:MAG: ATP-binding protein, partial [Thermodesulfobacteriota bacterium]